MREKITRALAMFLAGLAIIDALYAQKLDSANMMAHACFWWLVADREERQKGGAR